MAELAGDQAPPSLELCNSALRAAPFHRWLNLEVIEIGEKRIKILMPWREEIVSNPRIGSAHGGILASLIDLAGFYVLLLNDQPAAATTTLSTDYHRPAVSGPLFVESRIINTGRQLGAAESVVRNSDGELLASGRGLYLLKPQPDSLNIS